MKFLGLLLLAWSACAQPVLWQPPDNSVDHWTCGPGGCANTPAPPFQLVKEELSGSNPKVTVRDKNGRQWSAKFGAEVIPECFASRFVTALGYFAEPTYFVASGKLEGAALAKLRRARRVIKPDGEFARARFEARGQPGLEFLKDRQWAWPDNPFRGSHELAGLKIVMMLLSNWDAKDAREDGDSNTGVFRVTQAGRTATVYGVFDWGASLGRWGSACKRDQSDCAGFALDTPKFVRRTPNGLDWGFSGKHAGDLTDVTVDDLRWISPKLSAITDDQLIAGLKASGATDRQARCWTISLQNRIHQIADAAR